MKKARAKKQKGESSRAPFLRLNPATRRVSAYAAVILFLPLIAFAQATVPPQRAGKSAGELARRGEQLRRRWDLRGAEAAFRQAAAIDPSNLEALLGLAQVARAEVDYAKALGLLDRAAAHHPRSADSAAERGWIYLAAEEPARADRYLESALELDPSCVSAVIGRAGVDLLTRNYKGAEQRLRQCLSSNPQNSRAHALLGRVLLEVNQTGEAALEAQRALSIDPYDTDALYTLAFAKATERKPDEVRAFARRALALDPLNVGVRRLLSQYLDGRAGYEQKVSESARKLYERGRTLKQEGRISEATREFEAALSIEPRYYRALIALGDIWLRGEDYERAAAAARLAIAVDSEGALAHLELSYAHWGLEERARIEIGAVDFAAEFFKEARPHSFDLTNQIFPNYKSLTRRQQVVIDRAVQPLAGFLPKLARGGARHYLLQFDQRVSELDGFDDVAEEKTFDGRYYASIRGVGGRITVSGIEYIDLAARGGFHTIAHEFAHQVHMTALDRSVVKVIRRLYGRARREGRTLDYYAAANEYEYFAQGYEAFISDRKRPGAGVTARHTRGELLARDPDLYSFLVRLTGQSRQMESSRSMKP